MCASEAKSILDGAIAQAAKAISEGREAVQGLRSSVEAWHVRRGQIAAAGARPRREATLLAAMTHPSRLGPVWAKKAFHGCPAPLHAKNAVPKRGVRHADMNGAAAVSRE